LPLSRLMHETRSTASIWWTPTLSPAQLDQVMQLTPYALQKQAIMGLLVPPLRPEFPERPHTITWDSIEKMRSTVIDPKGLERHRR